MIRLTESPISSRHQSTSKKQLEHNTVLFQRTRNILCAKIKYCELFIIRVENIDMKENGGEK